MQKDRHGAAHRGTVAEMTGADAFAVQAVGVVLDDAHGGVHLAGVRELRAGDGIHAGCQALQHVEQLLRVGDSARKLKDEVDELAAPNVLLRGGLVFLALQRLQRLRDVFAEELDVLIDAAAGELADAEVTRQRLVEVDLILVVIEHALGAGKAKRFKHVNDLGLTVGRHDADGISGRVVHALFDLELDVDRFFFALGAGHAVVGEDARWIGLIARVLGRVRLGRDGGGWLGDGSGGRFGHHPLF